VREIDRLNSTRLGRQVITWLEKRWMFFQFLRGWFMYRVLSNGRSLFG
jgi:hypothetical protein